MVAYKGKNGATKAGIVSILSILLLMLGMAFVFFFTMKELNNSFGYRMIIIIWVLAFLFLNDWLEPYFARVFNEMTKAQGIMYIWYFAVDMCGFICLTVFVLTANATIAYYDYLMLAMFVLFQIPKRILYVKTIGVYKKAHRNKVKPVPHINVSEMELFSEPTLKNDRFENMEMKGYVNK